MEKIQVSNDILDSLSYKKELIKHIVRSEAVFALTQGRAWVNPRAFLPDQTMPRFYWPIYNAVVSVAHKCAPNCLDPVAPYIRDEIRKLSPPLSEVEFSELSAFLVWIYQGELAEEYYKDTFPAFCKFSRTNEAMRLYAKDPEKLGQALVEIDHEAKVSESDKKTRVRSYRTKPQWEDRALIPTGFDAVDRIIGGISHGDYALMVGYTGSGKTAMAAYLSHNWALRGFKVCLVSFEDTAFNMNLRMYATHWQLDYSEMRRPQSPERTKLEAKFDDPGEDLVRQRLDENFLLLDMKAKGNLSPAQVYAELIAAYEDPELKFQPDVVIIDQMQFLVSEERGTDQQWVQEGKVSSECDKLSHKLIGGKPFALIVNHQAKGAPKLYFNQNELQGFKGIIQPADWVFCIGRDGPMSNDFKLFSLKARHACNFNIPLYADLKHMSFSDRAKVNSTLASTQPPIHVDPAVIAASLMDTGYGTPNMATAIKPRTPAKSSNIPVLSSLS